MRILLSFILLLIAIRLLVLPNTAVNDGDWEDASTWDVMPNLMRTITFFFVFFFAFNHLFGQQIQAFELTTPDASQNGEYSLEEGEGDCFCYHSPRSFPLLPQFVIKVNPCTNSWSLYPGPDCSSTQPLLQLTEDLPDCNILNATPRAGISIIENPSFAGRTSCKDVTIDLGGSCVFMFSEFDVMTEEQYATISGFTINGKNLFPFFLQFDPQTDELDPNSIIDLSADPLFIDCDVVSVIPYSITYDDGGDCFGNIRIGSPVPPFPDTSECKTIPTLSEWGLILLSMSLSIFGIVGIRQQVLA